LNFKPVLIAAALTTFGAASTYAQTAPQTTPAAPAPTLQNQAKMDVGVSADTRKLIGRNIQNQNNETIGEIEAIFLNSEGKVDGVVVGVGGFLGINQREVLVSWKDLNIVNNGEKVTVNMTKDQIKAMPEYKYRDPSYRGQVFTDSGIYRDEKRAETRRAEREERRADREERREERRVDRVERRADSDRRTDNDRRMDTDRRAATERTPADRPAISTSRDFNADGHMSAEALIGASVRNANNEKVGEIVDVYVDNKGQIHTVVVSVGGFLGMGAKHVAVQWSELQPRRDGNSLMVTSNWTKDSLKAMPEYKHEQAQQK
jgi:sporulation protein YlmC with PRC-barrel domain